MPFGIIFKLIAKLCQAIFSSDALSFTNNDGLSSPFISRIFRGKGWLIIPIYFVSLIITIPYNTPTDGTSVRWDVIVTHFITGALAVYIAIILNRKTKKQYAASQIPFKTNDVFFFLSLKTWGIISIIMASIASFSLPRIEIYPTPALIAGNWDYDSKIKQKNITIAHQGNIIFQNNNSQSKTYTDTGTFNITIKQKPKNKILKFNVTEHGTWDQTKLILTLKNTNTKFTPANDSTKQFISRRSDFTKSFQKPKTKSTNHTITHFSESKMKTTDNDSSYNYKLTYEKQTPTKK